MSFLGDRMSISSREILEFITRHAAHKSMKYISSVAGTDAGNLHSCLAGKRALPFPMAQRVAAAVGLQASQVGNQLVVETAPHTVIYLEVEGAELPQLSAVLSTLAGKRTCSWLLVHAREEVGAGGVFAIAIAQFQECYVVINLTWSNSDEAYQMLDGPIHDVLTGLWLAKDPDLCSYSTQSAEWIRLRAGIESHRALDKLFMREAEPGIEDWAHLLVELHQMGAKPGAVSRLVEGVIRSADRRANKGDDPES